MTCADAKEMDDATTTKQIGDIGLGAKTVVKAKRKATPGSFKKGNKGGPGNPLLPCIARYRQAIIDGTPPEEILKVWAALMRAAKNGHVQACCEVLDRTIGKNRTLFGEEMQSQLTIQVVQLLANPAAMELANQLARQMADGHNQRQDNLLGAVDEASRTAVNETTPEQDLPSEQGG